MGSEMCIRDSGPSQPQMLGITQHPDSLDGKTMEPVMAHGIQAMSCLLYTSDAADERSSVDLGGRRIIKKKNR